MLEEKFQFSVIGLLPSDWICVPMSALISDISMGPFGSDIKVENFTNSGVPVLNGNNVKDVMLNDVISNYVTRKKASSLKKAVAHKGDIVITHRGTIGQIAYIPENSKHSKYVISQSQFRVTVDKNKVNPLFLTYYFHSMAGQRDLLEKRGHTGVPALAQPTTNFRKICVPLPSLPEQCRIATALSDMDAYFSALEKLIEKKRNIKKGAMQELLTGKHRLPGFKSEWTTCFLPEILCKYDGIKIGPFGSQLKKEYLVANGDYRIYGQENVYRNDFTFGSRYVTRDKFEELKSCEIKAGDFLISTMGTIGKCSVAPPGIHVGIMDSHLIRLRIDASKLLPQYLLHLFSDDFGYLENQTSRLSVGGIMDGLSTKIVGSLELEYPISIDEQCAIVGILNDMDGEIDMLTAKLNKSHHIKQGMMQELLSGRIRLLDSTSPEVKPIAKVIEMPKIKTKSVTVKSAGRNKAIEDAVILAVVTERYATNQYPLAPFYSQKFPYLLHRYMEGVAKGYTKKAAGPYNPVLKYKTALPIALKNRYVVSHKKTYKGHTYVELTIGENIAQAQNYFYQWYGDAPLEWLEQFRYIKNRRDELELLTTTDMSMVELLADGKPVNLQTVKEHIQASPEWKAKLKRSVFSDSNIVRAIRWSNELFGTEG